MSPEAPIPEIPIDPTRPGTAPDPDASRPLILPGGRVDPDAVRMAIGDSDTESDPDSEPIEAEGLARVTFKLSRDLQKRLDKYLTDRINFMSRTQLQRLIDEGGVTVNARPTKASYKLRINDTVEIALPPPPSTDIQPEAIPLNILYEDDALIVINKTPDIIVHPARSHLKGTLLNALVHHFRTSPTHTTTASLSSVGKEFARPGVVHRLDRRTSGVMVVAKEDQAHWKIGRQFENRQVEKRYLALVHGLIEVDADVIDVPIGPSVSKVKGHREKQQVRRDELGKPAVTIYRVIQRFTPHGFESAPQTAPSTDTARIPPHRLPQYIPAPEKPRASDTYTLVELELKTGRTHQIRVHLAHLGYPLVGDDMYGGRHLDLSTLASPLFPAPTGRFERQALHAALLGFKHPISQQPLIFTAPLPPDMLELIRLLRAACNASPLQHIPGALVDISTAIPNDPQSS